MFTACDTFDDINDEAGEVLATQTNDNNNDNNNNEEREAESPFLHLIFMHALPGPPHILDGEIPI